jgi:hypothetical protein
VSVELKAHDMTNVPRQGRGRHAPWNLPVGRELAGKQPKLLDFGLLVLHVGMDFARQDEHARILLLLLLLLLYHGLFLRRTSAQAHVEL